jgi:hypothetical protein
MAYKPLLKYSILLGLMACQWDQTAEAAKNKPIIPIIAAPQPPTSMIILAYTLQKKAKTNSEYCISGWITLKDGGFDGLFFMMAFSLTARFTNLIKSLLTTKLIT